MYFIIFILAIANLTKNNFNKIDSIETIKQNINNIKSLSKLTEKIDEFSLKKEKLQVFKDSNFLKYKIGQWIDAQDSLDQWVEAQIINMRNDRIQVHYNGWSSTRDEWIDAISPRLSLFRTYTLQSPFSKYISPSPNQKPETNLILADSQKFEDFDTFNDLSKIYFKFILVDFLDLIKEKLQKCVIEKDTISAKKSKLSEVNIFKYLE